MPRTTTAREIDAGLLEDLLTVSASAPNAELKVELAQSIRSATRDASRTLDRALFEQQQRMAEGLEAAQVAQEQLRDLLGRLAAPPWHPATFLSTVATRLGTRAMVLYNGIRRVVSAADAVDLAALVSGEEVLLGSDATVVTERSPYGPPRCGETATFERLTADGRCVVRHRDEALVIDAAGALATNTLRAGDLVRWDRAAWMAFERVERPQARRFLLEDVPDLARAAVGGQDASLDRLLSILTATLLAPEVARRYGMTGRRAVLMTGPPGCGKTLLARVVAAELQRVSGRRCRFAVVKPAEWESPWVGGTQENIRACFQALYDSVHDSSDLAVLFLDEIEAVGRIRGASANHHNDKFLAALLAELDGFADRTGIAVVAATNRKELIDPALLERLSDVEIPVRRPDLRGARAIFDIHLPEGVPLAPGTARADLVDAAVSRLYSPNADSATVATLRFRDGTTRTVAARELASGRLIAQICRMACERALDRDLRGEGAGLCLDDIAEAVGETLERLATMLKRSNAHAYLADLPEDADVVAVDPVHRLVSFPHRYHHAA